MKILLKCLIAAGLMFLSACIWYAVCPKYTAKQEGYYVIITNRITGKVTVERLRDLLDKSGGV